MLNRDKAADVRADLDKRPQDVAAMFDEVAARYDLTNAVLSLGQDRGWRKAVTQALSLTARDTVLDLAAGTATSTCMATDPTKRARPRDEIKRSPGSFDAPWR